MQDLEHHWSSSVCQAMDIEVHSEEALQSALTTIRRLKIYPWQSISNQIAKIASTTAMLPHVVDDNQTTGKSKVSDIIDELSQHPFFVEKIDEDAEELPPMIEAIRQLKWAEDDGPDENAIKFKDEGNLYFKLKKFRKSIISYTVGIELNPKDVLLLAQLYHNRGTANVQLRNYRRALNDFERCRYIYPAYLKVYVKEAKCLQTLGKYDQCVQLCMNGLEQFNDDEALIRELRKAKEQKNLEECKQRQLQQDFQLKIKKRKAIHNIIKDMNIKLELNEDILELADLDDTQLYWKISFIETDRNRCHTIEKCPSTATFYSQMAYLEEEEGSELSRKVCEITKLYYELDSVTTIDIDWSQTLIDFLTDDRMVIRQPVLEFYLQPIA
ncbi:hypothetical protein GJ496_008301 [Pomphorhynchus laevis]|nr:hypothetical protein GJ496_008301 [Pomphorhynchus laevis]